jgi:signal transduction histidine kinase
MAQLESGAYQLRPDAFDLRDLAKSAVTAFRQSAAAVGREVVVEAAAENMEVLADKAAVRQMMIKLLSNAVKFSEAGSVVSLILDFGSGGNCRLTVADHGIGMNEEEACLAVQPFQQVDSRLARQFEGTGLGLSITKKLIEAHNGNIEIVSVPMKGTRIVLNFESLRDDRVGAQREPGAPRASRGVVMAESLRHEPVLPRTVDGSRVSF